MPSRQHHALAHTHTHVRIRKSRQRCACIPMDTSAHISLHTRQCCRIRFRWFLFVLFVIYTWIQIASAKICNIPKPHAYVNHLTKKESRLRTLTHTHLLCIGIWSCACMFKRSACVMSMLAYTLLLPPQLPFAVEIRTHCTKYRTAHIASNRPKVMCAGSQ